jgi:hypothetical protein
MYETKGVRTICLCNQSWPHQHNACKMLVTKTLLGHLPKAEEARMPFT